MKNIVVSLSTSSCVFWLRVWKQMQLWPFLPMSTSWWWEQSQREVEKKVLKDKLLFWGEKKVQGCVSQDSDPMNNILRKVEELGLNASAGHIWNFQDAPGTKSEFGIEKDHRRAISKKVNLMSEILARPVLRNNHMRKPHDKQIVPAKSKVAWNLARKYASSSRTLNYVLFSCEGARDTEGAQMLSKENRAQIQWILWESPKHHKRLTATRDSAKKRVSTSFCSWSRSVHNSAITR